MKYLLSIFIPVLLFAEPVSAGGNEFTPHPVIYYNLYYRSPSSHNSFFVYEPGSAIEKPARIIDEVLN